MKEIEFEVAIMLVFEAPIIVEVAIHEHFYRHLGVSPRKRAH
jgi:hypothetical protein